VVTTENVFDEWDDPEWQAESDLIVNMLYEDALETEEPWALEAHEQRFHLEG
jgi:hypothetical protein